MRGDPRKPAEILVIPKRPFSACGESVANSHSSIGAISDTIRRLG